MTQADLIRDFAVQNYIAPARKANAAELTIRAGDIHSAMHLVNAMPAVCSAIGSRKFEALAEVTLLGISGPANGANVYLKFGLRPREALTPLKVVRPGSLTAELMPRDVLSPVKVISSGPPSAELTP